MTRRWDDSRRRVAENKRATCGSPNLLDLAGMGNEVRFSSESSLPLDNFGGYVDLVDEARSKQDGIAYVRACDEAGVKDSDKDEALYQQGVAELMVEVEDENRMLEGIERMIPKSSKPSKSKFNYEAFGKFLEGRNCIAADNVFEYIGFKRNALKAGGYTHLWNGKAEKVSIEGARDQRVGEVFKKCYQQYIARNK